MWYYIEINYFLPEKHDELKCNLNVKKKTK